MSEEKKSTKVILVIVIFIFAITIITGLLSAMCGDNEPESQNSQQMTESPF